MHTSKAVMGAGLLLLMAYLITHQLGEWRLGIAAGEDFYGLLVEFGITTAMLAFLAAFSASLVLDARND